MPKKKLKFFSDIKDFENVIEHNKIFALDHPLKSKWGKNYFKNSAEICLELGCGKGDYTIALAERYPHMNYIGIDIKGDRLHRGAKKALDKNLTNVAFLRIQVQEICYYFDSNEISEIWLTFPDPQPRKSKTNKRLSSKDFMEKYFKICKKNAVIHLKTDNPDLYQFSKETWTELNLKLLKSSSDLYFDYPNEKNISDIQTDYEQKYLGAGLKIHYLQAQIV